MTADDCVDSRMFDTEFWYVAPGCANCGASGSTGPARRNAADGLLAGTRLIVAIVRFTPESVAEEEMLPCMGTAEHDTH